MTCSLCELKDKVEDLENKIDSLELILDPDIEHKLTENIIQIIIDSLEPEMRIEFDGWHRT